MKSITKQIILLVKDSLIMLLIGLFINIIFAGFEIFSDWTHFSRVAAYNLTIGLSLWRGNRFISKLVDHKLSHLMSPEKTLLIHLSSTLVYSSVAIFIINYYLYEFLLGFDLFSNPRLFAIIGVIQLFIVLIITGVFYILDFLKSHKLAIREQEALKREALHHNYEALKNQLSPHFLFNSLSVLSALVEQDVARSQEFISQLSEVYRYVLDQKGEELVGLNKELEFVQSYIFLNQIRHDSSLRVEIDLEDKTGYVIPMSLQLLVENALKHNEISAKKPLFIKIGRYNQDSLIISNTLQPRKAIEGNGLGLGLLKKRCEFLLGKNVEVSTDDEMFTVILPIARESILASGIRN